MRVTVAGPMMAAVGVTVEVVTHYCSRSTTVRATRTKEYTGVYVLMLPWLRANNFRKTPKRRKKRINERISQFVAEELAAKQVLDRIAAQRPAVPLTSYQECSAVEDVPPL